VVGGRMVHHGITLRNLKRRASSLRARVWHAAMPTNADQPSA